MAHSRNYEKYKHLIGTQINKWTILDIITYNDKHHTYAFAQCCCGTVKEVRLTYIINGRSKDCGCGRKEMLRETRTKNLVGHKFGKLTVIELLEDSNKFNRRVYKCKCDCGSEINVPSSSLTTNHTLSCGCLTSYYNMYIRHFLEENKINFKSEYTIFVNDNYYRFDFYLPYYNLFIEYDGQQHYEPVRFYGSNVEENGRIFQKIQEHDEIKNRYCKENHINLLRIPYWESKNIETIINNCLQRLSEKGFVEQSAKYATV